MRTRSLTLQQLYEETARRFAERVREAFPSSVHAVVLYGSVARGTAGPGSDIDVLVLTSDGSPGRNELVNISESLDFENKYRTFLIAMPFTPDKLEELERGQFPIADAIIREGLVLYDDGTFERIRTKAGGSMTLEPSSEYVQTRLQLADDMLADARLLFTNSRLKSAADRAYYGMFHAAQAALGSQGVKAARSHRGLRSQFSEHLVATGILEKEYSKDLTFAHERRQESTYEAYGAIGDSDVAELIAKAEKFVSRIRRLVDEDR